MNTGDSHRDDLPELDAQQRELAQSLRAALRESEQLDYVSASKLRAARARAMSATPSRDRRWLFASGGLTAAAVLAVVLMTTQRPPTSTPFTETVDAQQADAIDVLTDDTDADFYEDLDLYRWLASDPSPATVTAPKNA